MKVRGDSGVDYIVEQTATGKYTCTCPHFRYRLRQNGGECKHILRVRGAEGKNVIAPVSASHKAKHSRTMIDKLLKGLSRMSRFVKRYAVCGSYRRGKETLGDLDIIVDCDEVHFLLLDAWLASKGRRVQGGDKKMRFVIEGVQFDVSRVPAASWGSALAHFTGPYEENIRLRVIARKKGYSLSQYGFVSLKTGKHLVVPTEKSVYAFLGEEYVEPSAR